MRFNLTTHKTQTQKWIHHRNETIIGEKYERERVCECRVCDGKFEWERKREQRREMREVNLTKICICGHTPTPKQTSVSKSHKYPHISSSVWGTLSHTLSLLTSLADTSAPWLMSAFTHTTDPSIAALWRGVWEKEENVKNKKKWKNSSSHSLLSLPLSLSLSYQLLSHSLSLSLFTFFTFLLWPTLSIHAEAINERSTYSLEKVCQTSHVFMMRHTENAKDMKCSVPWTEKKEMWIKEKLSLFLFLILLSLSLSPSFFCSPSLLFSLSFQCWRSPHSLTQTLPPLHVITASKERKERETYQDLKRMLTFKKRRENVPNSLSLSFLHPHLPPSSHSLFFSCSNTS